MADHNDFFGDDDSPPWLTANQEPDIEQNESNAFALTAGVTGVTYHYISERHTLAETAVLGPREIASIYRV